MLYYLLAGAGGFIAGWIGATAWMTKATKAPPPYLADILRNDPVVTHRAHRGG